MHQELLEIIQQNKTPTKGSHWTHTDNSDIDYVDNNESKDKEEKDKIDDNSTETEQVSGSKNKKILIMSLDGDEDSNSSLDDKRNTNTE